MAVIDRVGNFRATPFDLVVAEKGPNALLTVTVHFALTAEQASDGEYYDISPEQFSIIADFYLFKRDGGWNTYALDSLRSAFAWTDPDPFWLEDNLATLREKEVRLVIQMETWEGKTRPKVKYLDPLEGNTNRTATLEHAAPDARRAVAAKYGSKFRAQFGQPHTPAPPAAPPSSTGAPAPGPAPSSTGAPLPVALPVAVPATVTTPPRGHAPVALPVPPTATPDAAWAAYLELAVKAVDQPDSEDGVKHLNAKWFEIIAELFGELAPAQTDTFTPQQWGELVGKLPELLTPF